MAGPEEAATQGSEPDQGPSAPPPGHFVSAELEVDCARFLEQVRELAQRRAHALA
jgi:hypothetical protein